MSHLVHYASPTAVQPVPCLILGWVLEQDPLLLQPVKSLSTEDLMSLLSTVLLKSWPLSKNSQASPRVYVLTCL